MLTNGEFRAICNVAVNKNAIVANKNTVNEKVNRSCTLNIFREQSDINGIPILSFLNMEDGSGPRRNRAGESERAESFCFHRSFLSWTYFAVNVQTFLAAVIIAFAAMNARAATYYVRTDGHDTASGANDTANASTGAWLTINHATATAVAGDTINVGPGNFPEEVRCADHAGSNGSPVTIQATTPGATMVGSFTLEEPYINLSGFYVTNKSVFGAGGVFPQLYIAQNGSHCIVSNNTFNPRFDATISPIIKWNGADNQPFGVAGSFNTIISNTILNPRSEMVFRIFGDTNLVTGNFLGNLDFADCAQIFGRGNAFTYNVCSNLFFSGLNNNHADCFQLFGSAGGSSFGSKDHLIEGNIYIGGPSLTNSESLWQVGNMTDDGNSEVKNITIRNNIFIGIAAKCSVTMPSVYFYNNVFVRCGTNTQNGGAVLIYNSNAVGNATGGRVYNNIAIDCGLAGATNTGLTYFDSGLVNVKSDYNAVYKMVNGRLAAVQIDSSHRAVGDVGGWDTTDWWEPNGINGPKKNVAGTLSDVVSDPGLINWTAGDFRIQPRSVLIGSGLYLTNFTTDIRGASRGTSGWDIGPYKYLATDSDRTLACFVDSRVIGAYSVVSSGLLTLYWPQNPLRTQMKVYGRTATNKPSAWQNWNPVYTNNAATITNYGSYSQAITNGIPYEFQMEQLLSTNPPPCRDLATNGWRSYQYVSTGFNVPVCDTRGKIVLLVESGIASSISAELTQLNDDLVGAGYTVFRHDVAAVEVTAGGWSSAVTATKALITTDYNTDTSADWYLFIVGHVPIPYSGLNSPGSHVENFGAHPADSWYADMTGTWTDSTANDSSATTSSAQFNTPGDGKFDQSFIPAAPTMRVGRIDFKGMPAFSKTEVQLLQQYFARNHAWRHGQVSVRKKALVYSDTDPVLQNADKPIEAHDLAASIFGGLTGLAGAPTVERGNWLTFASNPATNYLFAMKQGSGHFTEDVQMGTIESFAATNYQSGVFESLFGSYYGDWDTGINTNDFLWVALASAGNTVASYYHANNTPMNLTAMDEPIGFDLYAKGANKFAGTDARYTDYVRITAGTGQESLTIEEQEQYITLLGDPTILIAPTIPPSSVTNTPSGADNVITWTGSTDENIDGYHVYRASTSTPNTFTRLTTSTTTSPYTDTGAASGSYRYMVRAVKYNATANRTFYSASQGVFSAAGTGGGGSSTGGALFSGRPIISGKAIFR